MINMNSYQKVCPEFKKKFDNLVEEADSICITGHLGMDEDALASVLAIHSYLTKYPDKSIRMISSGDLDDRFSFLDNFEKIEIREDIANHLKGFDLLIMLDGAEYDRFTRVEGAIEESGCKTVVIDHHGSEPDDFDLRLVDSEASSCVEIIYQLFFRGERFKSNLSETLMLGILEDTGNFSYLDNNQLEALLFAKEIMEEVEMARIQNLQNKYKYYSKEELQIMARLLQNVEFHHVEGWPKFQTSFLSIEYVEKNNRDEIKSAYHAFMGNYLLKIPNYSWGFVLIPDLENDQIGVSFRSLDGSVSVKDLAVKLGGGGHTRAAGAGFELKEETNVEHYLQAIINRLTSSV